MKKPLVCILILNWNGKETTLNYLRSLKKTSYSNYKIIVLDNGSTDGSVNKIKSEFKKVDVVELNANKGYTKAVNYGFNYCIKKYNPKYFCGANNDLIVIQRNWLSLMVDELEKDSKRGVCGNKLLFPDGRVQLLYLERNPKEYNEIDKGDYDFVKEVSAVGGANMLIKQEVIKKIGGLDENYFYGPDDIDFCFRARKAGFKIVYNGYSKTTHLGSFSYLSSSKDFIYGHQSLGKMIFAFRWEPIRIKIKTVFQQFIRAFITRKDPFYRRDMGNLYFHKSFIKRNLLFIKSLFSALVKYKKVNITEYPDGKET